MKKLLSFAFVITLISSGEVWGSSIHQDYREGQIKNDVRQTSHYYQNRLGCNLFSGCG